VTNCAVSFEFTDLKPQLAVLEAEYVRLLGFPPKTPLEGRARELADWARAWYAEHGRPWLLARPTGGAGTAPGGIAGPGFTFSSTRLQRSFAAAEAHDAMLLAVSAGPECEQHAQRCWQEEKPDEYFFLEMYGSAVVESLVAQGAGRICAWADQSGLGVLPHYSPGYPGWPISDQTKLWRLFQNGERFSFPRELAVLDTGMLNPKKSLLAIFGITRHPDKVRTGSHLVPCESCCLRDCQYRRAPYRYNYDETLRY
jgi:hypothetical protein